MKHAGLRCSGTKSTHSVIAVFKCITTSSFHLGPRGTPILNLDLSTAYYKPAKIQCFHLMKERTAQFTIVVNANAMIWVNLTRQLKDVTNAGFPGGCWKAKVASSFSQYSSSTSMGRSRSKLFDVSVILRTTNKQTYSVSRAQHGLPR